MEDEKGIERGAILRPPALKHNTMNVESKSAPKLSAHLKEENKVLTYLGFGANFTVDEEVLLLLGLDGRCRRRKEGQLGFDCVGSCNDGRFPALYFRRRRLIARTASGRRRRRKTLRWR